MFGGSALHIDGKLTLARGEDREGGVLRWAAECLTRLRKAVEIYIATSTAGRILWWKKRRSAV